MASKQTVLVLAATGNQGSQVATQLLARKHNVHALTRDPESTKATKLQSLGAKLCKGSLDDFNSIKSAAQGCTAVFLVLLPNPSELEHARTVIEAARAAGVSKCVYSSVVNCEKIVKRPDFDRTGIRASYFLNKVATQELVMSQFPSWTILQPGAFMTNMVDPVAQFYFPKLKSEHILHGPWKPETKMGWIDTADIGKFAIASFESDNFEHKVIPLVGDPLTVTELAGIIDEVSGQNIQAEYIGDEEVAAQKDHNPLVTSGDWTNNGYFDVDVVAVRGLGIQMNTAKDFLTRQKKSGLLEKTLGSDS